MTPQLPSLWDISLPLWNIDRMRLAPNPALRGGLFGMAPRGEEELLKDYLVYEDANLVVTYTGVSLGQADLDVWMRIIQLVGQRFIDRSQKTVAVEITPSAFMRDIGRTGGRSGRIGNNDRDWLVKSLTRLTGAITIRTPDDKKGIVGNLVKGVAWNDEQNRLVVEVDNKIGYLFAARYTMLSSATRIALMGDDMALWLHAFIAAHRGSHGRSEFFYSVDTLREKSRSRIADRSKFKYFITQKMKKLMALPEEQRGFFSWEWENRYTLRVHYVKSMEQGTLVSSGQR